MSVDVAVYADWFGLSEPLRLGVLHAQRSSGREVFDFEFDGAAIAHPAVTNLRLDPRLGPFEGRQHPRQGSETFGVFADASPDRWGRLLMRRGFEREQRAGLAATRARLYESDYLLGVHDTFRSGALRFRLDDTGDFLDNRHGVAAPPFLQLRQLELASLALERDDDNTAPAGDDWLRMFNVLVSNTDDHLRNHGFILVPGKWWRLSDAYDVNAVPDSSGLKLNISEADNAMDIDLVRSVAPYFRVDRRTADEIIECSIGVVRQWPKIAARLGVSAQEQGRMASAFQLAA